MATLAVTNSFSAGTTIVAADMNTNFDDIEAFINTTPGVVQEDLIDAVGDLIHGDAADSVGRLAVGTNAHCLVADSTVSNVGLKWAVPTDTTKLPLAGGTMSGETIFADQLVTRPEMKDYGETVNAIGGTGGGTQSLNIALGNVQTATVDTSTNTFTFDNPSPDTKSCSFTLILTNGGSQTVVWPTTVQWAGGTAPTLTTSGRDVLTFMTIDAGAATWYGFAAGLDMSVPS